MFEITKEHKFEAAHRLVKGYPGKCKHLHGHSWVVKVTVADEELDKYDMAFDFGSFKPLWKWIDDMLDHATIVSREDADLCAWLTDRGQRIYITEANPTSEVLCRVIYDEAKRLGIPVSAVEINETCTSAARWFEKGI